MSKHHKDTCWKEIGLHLHILITTIHLVVEQLGGSKYSIKESNKHALSINISKSGEGQFSIWFLQMFRRIFANVTQVFCVNLTCRG